MREAYITVDDLDSIIAHDVSCYTGDYVPVSKAAPHLEQYYRTTPRYNYKGGVTGQFWNKVQEIVEILHGSNEWPFKPVQVRGGVLYDGHHRCTAALVAGWDKPIPVE